MLLVVGGAAVGLLLAVFAWDFGFVGVGGGFWVAALMVLGGLGFAACLCCCFGMGMLSFLLFLGVVGWYNITLRAA